VVQGTAGHFRQPLTQFLLNGIQLASDGTFLAEVLIGCQAGGKNHADFFRLVGQKQIQNHGEIDADLAPDGIWRRIEQIMDELWVLIRTGGHQHKPDLIHTAPAGPAGHLQQIRGSQVDKVPAIETITLQNDNRTRREIDPRSHGWRWKNGLQLALLHQLFQE
jgi:hypothetical protein